MDERNRTFNPPQAQHHPRAQSSAHGSSTKAKNERSDSHSNASSSNSSKRNRKVKSFSSKERKKQTESQRWTSQIEYLATEQLWKEQPLLSKDIFLVKCAYPNCQILSQVPSSFRKSTPYFCNVHYRSSHSEDEKEDDPPEVVAPILSSSQEVVLGSPSLPVTKVALVNKNVLIRRRDDWARFLVDQVTDSKLKPDFVVQSGKFLEDEYDIVLTPSVERLHRCYVSYITCLKIIAEVSSFCVDRRERICVAARSSCQFVDVSSCLGWFNSLVSCTQHAVYVSPCSVIPFMIDIGCCADTRRFMSSIISPWVPDDPLHCCTFLGRKCVDKIVYQRNCFYNGEVIGAKHEQVMLDTTGTYLSGSGLSVAYSAARLTYVLPELFDFYCERLQERRLDREDDQNRAMKSCALDFPLHKAIAIRDRDRVYSETMIAYVWHKRLNVNARKLVLGGGGSAPDHITSA